MSGPPALFPARFGVPVSSAHRTSPPGNPKHPRPVTSSPLAPAFPHQAQGKVARFLTDGLGRVFAARSVRGQGGNVAGQERLIDRGGLVNPQVKAEPRGPAVSTPSPTSSRPLPCILHMRARHLIDVRAIAPGISMLQGGRWGRGYSVSDGKCGSQCVFGISARRPCSVTAVPVHPAVAPPGSPSVSC